jgi:hypothetical protein
MAKKILYIDRSAFLDWYFDHDTRKDFIDRHSVVTNLILDGKFEITADELLADVGYLPENVVFCGQKPKLDQFDEVDMNAYDEIKFMATHTQPA